MIYFCGLLYCSMLMSFGSIGSGFEITVRICGRIKSRLKITVYSSMCITVWIKWD